MLVFQKTCGSGLQLEEDRMSKRFIVTVVCSASRLDQRKRICASGDGRAV